MKPQQHRLTRTAIVPTHKPTADELWGQLKDRPGFVDAVTKGLRDLDEHKGIEPAEPSRQR